MNSISISTRETFGGLILYTVSIDGKVSKRFTDWDEAVAYFNELRSKLYERQDEKSAVCGG